MDAWNNYLGELAMEAPRIQQRLDQEHSDRLDDLRGALSDPSTAEFGHLPGLAAAILPARSILREWKVTLQCELRTVKEGGGTVFVRPLNAGYSIAFGSTTESGTRIDLEIRQTPPGAVIPESGPGTSAPSDSSNSPHH